MTSVRHASSSDVPGINFAQTTAQMQRMLRQSSMARIPSTSSSLVNIQQRRGGSRSSMSSLMSFSGAFERRERERQPTRSFEPTYRTGPERKFPQNEIEAMIEETLERYLAEERYVASVCKQMGLSLTDIIKGKAKAMIASKRYKIVVVVHIGQLRGQTMRIVSRSLWDDAVDNYASASFKNSTLFAVGIVYGVYQE